MVDKGKRHIEEYQTELLEHVQRMATLEQVELERQATSLMKEEDKTLNHGKDRNYF